MRLRFRWPNRFGSSSIAIGFISVSLLPAMVLMAGRATMPFALAIAGRALVPTANATQAAKSPSTPNATPTGAPPEAPPTLREDAALSATTPAGPDSKEAAKPVASSPELALLQDLRNRRGELDSRAEALAAREQLLAAAEQRIADRVGELTALQNRLEALDKIRRDRDESSKQNLVKIYEKMRPRDAATIFNDLDETILTEVLDRMKQNRAAAVLGLMLPERARVATAHLAEWRRRKPSDPES